MKVSYIKRVTFLVSTLFSVHVFANECFIASGKALSDAQQIRKSASDMGWQVGKASSVTAGAFIKGKAAIYPQDKLEVCLREKSDGLEFRAQSLSSDAGKAEWRTIPAKRK